MLKIKITAWTSQKQKSDTFPTTQQQLITRIFTNAYKSLPRNTDIETCYV